MVQSTEPADNAGSSSDDSYDPLSLSNSNSPSDVLPDDSEDEEKESKDSVKDFQLPEDHEKAKDDEENNPANGSANKISSSSESSQNESESESESEPSSSSDSDNKSEDSAPQNDAKHGTEKPLKAQKSETIKQSEPDKSRLEESADKSSEPKGSSKSQFKEEKSLINVTDFNNVMTFFLTGPLLKDDTFNGLESEQKELVILKAYNDTHDTKTHVHLNFGATTSYNKSRLRPSDRYETPVPVNPFCLRPDLTKPMTEEERQSYDEYMRHEDTLSSGKWDDYPIGSRLFIGNLAVNTLRKEDVFRIFHPYGKIMQVNLKQGFGFIQYTTAEECSKAIQGESNVPLHNKFMHLQVSKHQIQRAMERENDSYSRTRGRSRSPPPSSNDSDSNYRERPPLHSSSPEVKVYLTTSSSEEFNDKLISRLKAAGVNIDVEKCEEKVGDVPQEKSLDCAYHDFLAVILTGKNDLVNIMVFEKDQDDGIKFDEYTDLSIDSALELALSSKAKNFARTNRGSVPSSLPTPLTKVRSPPNRYGASDRRYRNERYRRFSPRDSRDQQYDDPRRGPSYGGRDVYNPTSASSYYSPRNRGPTSQIQQHGYYEPESSYVQADKPYNQLHRNNQRQRGSYYRGDNDYRSDYNSTDNNNNNYQNSHPSNGFDPNTMQQMMNLMKQAQQGNTNNNNQQQQLAQMIQMFQGNQQTSNSPTYGNQRMETPTNANGNKNVLASLLGQLQSSVPGSKPPPPFGSSNPTSNSLPNQNNPSNGQNQDQTGDLFETLARLKNNM